MSFFGGITHWFQKRNSVIGTAQATPIRVNSCHHQCIARTGTGLQVVQRCTLDACPEAIVHESLPILGVQWHPERLTPSRTSLAPLSLLRLFASNGSENDIASRVFYRAFQEAPP